MTTGATNQRTEELTVARFSVDIQGEIVGDFTECSGLNGEIEVETYQEGGLNEYEHKLPGRVKYGNVTLKNGLASALSLWDWFHSISTGQVKRREISIVMYMQYREGAYKGEAMRWNLTGAYPVRWEGPAFAAADNAVAIQSLEMAHHGITLSKS